MERRTDPSWPRSLLLVLLPFSFVLLATPAESWVWVKGAPLSWATSEATLILDLGCPTPDLTNWGPCWADAAEAAAAAWNAAGSSFRFQTKRETGLHPCTTRNSFRNFVVFRPVVCGGGSFGTRTLALTQIIKSGTSGTAATELRATRVWFNSALNWSTYTGSLQTDNHGRRIHDFYRVALHEFGHALGLGHPNEKGQSVSAIMNSRVSALYQLQPDDILGINTIYPQDNRVPVSLSVSDSGEAVEGQAALTITATLTQPNTSGSAYSIPIRVRPTGTTAQAADYAVASSISIADTETTGTTTFTVTNDTTDEADEQVIVELGSPLPADIKAGTPNHVTVTLTDNDPTTVTFSIPDTTATEGDATATARLRLTLNRALVANESLDIPLQFSGGTLGTDFALALSGSPTGVTFSAGTVTFTGPSTTRADLVLTAATDANATDETVTVSIPTTSTGNTPKLTATNLDGGATGSGSGQISITDVTPVLTIMPGSSAVTEGTAAAFTVSASPAPAANLTVNLTVAEDTSGGQDFVLAANEGSGQTVTVLTSGSATFSVPTEADKTDEPNGAVTVTIDTGANYVVGSPRSASVTVNDNDDPPVDLSVSNSGAVTEGNTLTVTATVGQAPSGRSLAIPVRHVAVHSTAATTDYTLSGTPAGTITVADGQTSGSLILTATNDTFDEPAETLRLALGTLPSGYDPGTARHVDLTIADDDANTVTLEATDTTATEGSTSATGELTLTLNRRLIMGEALAIPLQFSGATKGTHFVLGLTAATGVTFQGSNTVTFTGASTPSATTARFTVTALTDTNTTDETLTVSIPSTSTGNAPTLTTTNLGGGATGSRTGNGQVVLTDAGTTTITPLIIITPGPSPVTEGTAASFTVTASPAPTTGLPVSLAVKQQGNFAASGTTGATVTIGTGGTAPYTVTTLDDQVDEAHGSIQVTITAGNGYTVGNPASASVSVHDDDEPPPVVSFARATASVSEEAVSSDVTVILTPPPSAGLTLFYTLSGAATWGDDYVITGVTGDAGSLTVPSGESSVDIPVDIFEDAADEGNETVILTLTDNSHYVVDMNRRRHTLTIRDNDRRTPPPTTGGGGPTGGGGGGATVRDTHGNRPRTATVLPLSPTTRRPTEPGQLVSGRDVDYFRLELPQPGLLWVESRSSLDTRGRLFDADAGLLEEDDNSGARRNFAVATAVEQGTHYIAVDSPRGSTGAYTLAIDYRPGYLGIPWAESIQSGIGVLSGWICEAAEVVLEIEAADGRLETYEAGAGTERQDTAAACGHPDSGYGLLFNWANLAAGPYTVRAVVDGVVLDTHNVTVVPIGPEPFVRGLRGTYPLADFPQVGATTQVVWSEAQQGFVIGVGEITPGPEDTPGDFTRYVLGNPGAGTYQSGVGVLSGWACEAETVAVVITPETGEAVRVEAAYGTERRDTREECGDVDNGYGVLFNWNRLGDGEYVVDLLVDGQAVAQSTVRVTTLGAEFARGLRGTYAVEGFPTPEQTTTIEWQQQRQNFGIVGVE